MMKHTEHIYASGSFDLAGTLGHFFFKAARFNTPALLTVLALPHQWCRKNYDYHYICLVVWNMTLIFPYVGNSHPNWQIFFWGVETTNQIYTKKAEWWWWSDPFHWNIRCSRIPPSWWCWYLQVNLNTKHGHVLASNKEHSSIISLWWFNIAIQNHHFSLGKLTKFRFGHFQELF